MMDVVIMIGIPGSGKSTMTRTKFPQHTHISLDTNKTMGFSKRGMLIDRYESEGFPPENLSGNRKVEYVMIHDALKSGENVVIDNTNVTADIRGPYIRLAKLHGASVSAVYFRNTEQAYMWNAGRAAKPGEERVPDSVLDDFFNKLEAPKISEGFNSIQTVD